jgi:seryl-tRNA synthetase
MLSIDFIRANVEKVKVAAKNKNREVDIDQILQLDEKRRGLIQDTQKLREERNALSKQKPTDKSISKGKKIKEELSKIDENLRKTQEELDSLMLYVPNVPLEEVPVGKDESSNEELKTWGEIPKFDFTPKDHVQLGLDLDIFDFDRGSKVSGFRGYFLKNEGALLHFALVFYTFQKLVKKGYTPMIAPTIVKEFALFGSGHFPWSKESDDVYKTQDQDMYLSGTAEIPLMAYHSGETLSERDLPKKYVGFSPCYRREIGSYGKDTKGLYRVHEFWKIEQVILGKNDLNQAYEIHDELEQNSEEVLQDLNLPYRQLLMCTGDMGEPQLKKFDIETWMPSRGNYGETMSNSIMGDFQTRRLNIKYKDKEGKKHFCYSYNNTAVASPRILVAVLENYQNKDGSITVPEVLRPLMGIEVIRKK